MGLAFPGACWAALIGSWLLQGPAERAEGAIWRAGLARAVITPAGPMWLAGYAARAKPSEGIAQDLFAKALAIEDAKGTRLVIVTLDLISVPRTLRDWLEQEVGRRYDLAPAALLMNCSHTHCGPELRTTSSSLVGVDPDRVVQAREYVARLQASLLAIVGQALERLAPARLAYCRARCGFAMNRRTPAPTGFRNFPNPDGPVDHDVPVLLVADPDGRPQGVLFGYACHNTTLGFYEFCGDYAGYAQQYLEEAHPGIFALFLMGCGGDQNPYPRRTLDLAQRHGRALATAVEAALETERRWLNGPLSRAYDYATLEYQAPPSREQLVERAASANDHDRLHAQRLLAQLDSDGKLRDRYDCPVQVVRLGNELVLVALPGETVVDYSLRLKGELTGPGGSPAGPAVWVAGYSNDVFAYIPSRRVLLEGGYEAGDAMKFMTTVVQPGPFAPSVEERLVTKVHQLIRSLDSH